MYVDRDVRDVFRKVSGAYNVVAVVGPRQAGKTTFLREEIKGMHSSYVLFDDPDARNLFEEDVKKFEKQYLEGYDVAVLDEVQYCRDAGRKIKYLEDKGVRMWITSSTETLLGKDVLSYLVGRVSIIRLYPFSLSEFLVARGFKETTPEILRRSVWEHLTYGGYPKVVTTTDIELKKIILRDLYETMLLKDVSKNFSIEDVRALEDFARYLAANQGSLLSYENIARDVKLSFRTVKKYLDAMEKSYLIVRITPYHTNKTKEITKQPKVYFVDTGLRNAIAKDYRTEPEGRQFENYVLTEIMKIGYTPKYWRMKAGPEVDYVIEKDGETIPVEVKINAEEGRIKRSMRSFIEAYGPKKAIIVSYNGPVGKTKVGGCEITYTDALGMRDALGRKSNTPA